MERKYQDNRAQHSISCGERSSHGALSVPTTRQSPGDPRQTLRTDKDGMTTGGMLCRAESSHTQGGITTCASVQPSAKAMTTYVEIASRSQSRVHVIDI